MERIARFSAIGFILVALVVMAGVPVVGCGGSDQEQAKADLNTALVDLESAFTGLKGQSATLTVGDLKKTEPLAALVDKVIEAAKQVSGVDVTTFQTAFQALRLAVFSFPDDTPVVVALMQLMPQALEVLQAGEALKQSAAP